MYQIEEEKSKGIRNAERRKSEKENTNHHNSQHLYLEMSLFCTTAESTPPSPPSLHSMRATLWPQGDALCHPPLSFMALEGEVHTSHWLAMDLFWN